MVIYYACTALFTCKMISPCGLQKFFLIKIYIYLLKLLLDNKCFSKSVTFKIYGSVHQVDISGVFRQSENLKVIKNPAAVHC
jgi:hypothetical protein